MNLTERLEKARKSFDEKLEEQKALYETAEKANRSLENEEEEKFDDLQKGINELEKEINRLESMIKSEKYMGESDGTQELLTPVFFDTQTPAKDNGGFKSVGEFFDAVRFGDKKDRLSELRKDISTDDFGFMMPPALYDEIMEVSIGQSIVRPRAMVLPAGNPPDSSVVIPSLDQNGDTSNLFGGVEVQWIEEGALKPLTDIKLKSVTITPYELAASMKVTDKALRNFTALSPMISRNFGAAIAYAEDVAFFNGAGDSGTPKTPNGILKSAALVKVNRATAGSVDYTDIVQLESRMLPNSRASAIWVIDLTLYDDIKLLQDPSGRYIFGSGDVSQGRPDKLNGRPIEWTDKTATGGVAPTMGDIGLYDFGYYVIKDGYGPIVQASPHPYFQNNTTIIKAFTNVGGAPWLSAPLKLQNGISVSPFVVLDIPNP